MRHALNLLGHSRLAFTFGLMLGLSSTVACAQATPWPAKPSPAQLTTASARVDGLLHGAEAVKALRGEVACRAEALQSGGSWLLVSRSWGGSPHLRQRQLVAWAPGQPQPAGRVDVAWRVCGRAS